MTSFTNINLNKIQLSNKFYSVEEYEEDFKSIHIDYLWANKKLQEIIDDYTQNTFHKELKEFGEEVCIHEENLLNRELLFEKQYSHISNILPSIVNYRIAIKKCKDSFFQETSSFFNFSNFVVKHKEEAKKIPDLIKNEKSKVKLLEWYFYFLNNLNYQMSFQFSPKFNITEKEHEEVNLINGQLLLKQENFKPKSKHDMFLVQEFVFRIYELLELLKKQDELSAKLKRKYTIYDVLEHFQYQNQNSGKSSYYFVKELFNVNSPFKQ